MNPRHIWAIARKDLREASRNQSVWLPMLIVPLVFIVIFPLVIILLPSMPNFDVNSLTADPDLKNFMTRMPPFMLQSLAGLNDLQTMLMLTLGYMFAPMFLIIPLMFSTTIASESFAGEYERKTMEALLYTAASDAELFLGKMMAGLLPAVGLAWASFGVYVLLLNTAGWPIFGRLWFPIPTWYPLIFWVTPALAVLGVSTTVLISAKVHTFMGAYQTSASTVVLVLALVIGQATGLVYLSIAVGLLLGLVLWILDAALIWFAVRIFNRKALLASAA